MIVPNFQERERVINPMATNDEVVTVKEASKLLQIHESKVFRMIREGKIPSLRIGKDLRLRKDRLVSWLAEQRQRLQ
jgi:excisionase family DNA binding protein